MLVLGYLAPLSPPAQMSSLKDFPKGGSAGKKGRQRCGCRPRDPHEVALFAVFKPLQELRSLLRQIQLVEGLRLGADVLEVCCQERV